MTNPPFPDSPSPDSPSPASPPPPPAWNGAPGAEPAPSYPTTSNPTAPAGYPGAGAPTYPAYPAPEPSPPGRVLSIVGLVLAFLLAPVGLIISIVAAVKLGKAGAPKGLAIAGIIIGAVITIIEIIGVILLVTVFIGLFSMCADLGPGIWEVGGVTYTCG